jgi:hypothetical protein
VKILPLKVKGFRAMPNLILFDEIGQYPDHYEARNCADILKPSAGSGSMNTPRPVTVIRNPEVTISGIHRCCSAMNVCGIHGYGQQAHYDKLYAKMRPYQYKDTRSWHQNFQKALDHYTKKAPCQYHIPWRLRYLPAMLKCYTKGSQGEGGQNMWAASYYATRTVFMVDRRSMGDGANMSVHGFIDWLSTQRNIGKVAVGGYADGAHGGKCRGAVWAIEDKLLEAWLKKAERAMQRHWAKADKYAVPPEQIEPIDDDVARLW